MRRRKFTDKGDPSNAYLPGTIWTDYMKKDVFWLGSTFVGPDLNRSTHSCAATLIVYNPHHFWGQSNKMIDHKLQQEQSNFMPGITPLWVSHSSESVIMVYHSIQHINQKMTPHGSNLLRTVICLIFFLILASRLLFWLTRDPGGGVSNQAKAWREWQLIGKPRGCRGEVWDLRTSGTSVHPHPNTSDLLSPPRLNQD